MEEVEDAHHPTEGHADVSATRSARFEQDATEKEKDNNRKRGSIPICKQVALTAGAMALNFTSAVGIVVVNKALFRWGQGLRFATVLTAAHFLTTAVGIRVCHVLRVYDVKPLRQLQVLPITVSFCAFVVFNNLSLQSNGISFYQLMKTLTTPAVVVLQLLFFKVALPIKLALCLVPICVGVALSTWKSEGFPREGAFWATAGLLAAATYQLLVKSTQATLQVSSMQLLHYQAPQAAVLVLLMSPLFDDTGVMLTWARAAYATPEIEAEDDEVELISPETAAVATTVLLSCFLAFLVNLSLFLVIGRTSPVSYQVLGHFKLVVILAAGVTMFGEHAEPLRLLGMAVALAGIVGYTTLKQSLGSGWERKSARSARSDDDVDAENVGEQARNIKRNTTAGPVYTVKRH